MTNTLLENQGTGASEARKQAKLGRRALLRKAMVASGVIAGAHLLPEKWFRPLVEQIVVPVHAQTSGEPEEPPENSKRVFFFTESDYRFVVPAGVTRINVKLDGGDGGGGGGGTGGAEGIIGGNGGAGSNGQTTNGMILVTPGDALIFRIGGGGSPGLGGGSGSSGAGGVGGWPDGSAGDGGVGGAGGGGGSGGTTSIFRESDLTTPLLSAPGGSGGGGGGYRETEGTTGSNGENGWEDGFGGNVGGGDGGRAFVSWSEDSDDFRPGGLGGYPTGADGFPGSNGEIEIFI